CFQDTNGAFEDRVRGKLQAPNSRENPSSKLQIPIKSQAPNSKRAWQRSLLFAVWHLGFGASLEFGAWSLEFSCWCFSGAWSLEFEVFPHVGWQCNCYMSLTHA